MKRSIIFFILCLVILSACSSQKNSIDTLLNKEIFINNGFAGQSISLIKEGSEYFINRVYFGSGIPVIGISRYKVDLINENKIKFSKIVEQSGAVKKVTEEFTLIIGADGQIKLFLNGLQLDLEIND